jgi:hypothetical protein
MFKAPKKYITACTVKSTDRLVFDRIYEAIDRNEAEARAWLNCLKEYNNPADISISVDKI